MNNKKTIIISAIIILVVIGALVFVTTKGPVAKENSIPGVKITVLNEGTGDVAKIGDSVSVNYTGKLADGTVFDSNTDPKFKHVEPLTFTLGAGQVIKGWDTGIVGMKVGEKSILEIAPEAAYGTSGVGPIPPNSTLVFEVELLGIKK